MNMLFRATSFTQYSLLRTSVNSHLSVAGAQKQMVFDLNKQETRRVELFKQELAEREELDVLDRARLKALHSKQNGVLSAVDFHKIDAKIESLKKLRFTEDYEKLQDSQTYEWMKYKVAAEVGGDEERAQFELYNKVKIQEKGEERFRLFTHNAETDPVFEFLNPQIKA